MMTPCSVIEKYKYFDEKSVSHNQVEIWNMIIQGGSNMTGTDLCVSKPHCAAAVRP